MTRCSKAYCIPGLGTDKRLFSKYHFTFPIEVLEYFSPEPDDTMNSYAKKLSQKIDTSKPFILIGVSMGGMLAVEMTRFLSPQMLILVSSAKTYREIPLKWRLFRFIPIYRLISDKLIIFFATLFKFIFGITHKEDEKLFTEMLSSLPPNFYSRAIHLIVNWKNNTYPENLIHIHGNKDQVLPYSNIKDPITIEGGSHWMIFDRANEISEIINRKMKCDDGENEKQNENENEKEKQNEVNRSRARCLF